MQARLLSARRIALETPRAGVLLSFVVLGCGGAGTTATVATSPPSEATLTAPARLNGGNVATCFVAGPGNVTCWGLLPFKPLPTPPAVINAALVAPAALTGAPGAVAVSLGAGAMCALDAEGRVRCAGIEGPQSASFSDVELGEKAVAIGGGASHACAILGRGAVSCWGNNPHGEAGAPPSEMASPHVVAGVSGVVGLALGLAHTCALAREGKVLCWGNNDVGMLGDGTTTPRADPREVPGIDHVVRVASRQLHTCALKSDGSVWCWGVAVGLGIGTGGDDSYEGVLKPVRIQSLDGASAISVGNAHTCALKGGHVHCVGSNAVGQLGDGSGPRQRATAKEVPGLSDVVEIAAGGGHTCALTSDDTVHCWGAGPIGQTAQGTEESTPLPKRVLLTP